MNENYEFEFSSFCGDLDFFCVNQMKYSMEEALEIAREENGWYSGKGYIEIGSAYTKFDTGFNEIGEQISSWWLEDKQDNGSCPVWRFRVVREIPQKRWSEEVMYVPIESDMAI